MSYTDRFLADYYQVPGLWKACESWLKPLVCEENILEVLRVLKPFEDVHADYKQVVFYVMAMVKHSEKCSRLCN